MIKKTENNFAITVSILQNQCFMNYYKACEKANRIFKTVANDRKNGKQTTVEDYLLLEINLVQ